MNFILDEISKIWLIPCHFSITLYKLHKQWVPISPFDVLISSTLIVVQTQRNLFQFPVKSNEIWFYCNFLIGLEPNSMQIWSILRRLINSTQKSIVALLEKQSTGIASKVSFNQCFRQKNVYSFRIEVDLIWCFHTISSFWYKCN